MFKSSGNFELGVAFALTLGTIFLSAAETGGSGGKKFAGIRFGARHFVLAAVGRQGDGNFKKTISGDPALCRLVADSFSGAVQR